MLQILQPLHNIDKTIQLFNVLENLQPIKCYIQTNTGPTLYSRFCSRAKGSPFPSQQLRSSHGSKVDGARLEPWLFLCTQPLLYLALTSDFVLFVLSTSLISSLCTRCLYHYCIVPNTRSHHCIVSATSSQAQVSWLGSWFSFLIKTHKMLFEKHMWHYSTEVLLSSQNGYIYGDVNQHYQPKRPPSDLKFVNLVNR